MFSRYFVEVTARLPQHRAGDVRGDDQVVAALQVEVADPVLQLLPEDPAAGCQIHRPGPSSSGLENRSSSRPRRRWSRFSASSSRMQVRVEILLGRPRRPVDPGEHRVRLDAAPVRAGGRGQLERAEPAGRRDVRSFAEVDPSVVAVERHDLARGDLTLGRSPIASMISRLKGWSSRRASASSRVTSSRMNGWSSATIFRISPSIAGRSSSPDRGRAGRSRSRSRPGSAVRSRTSRPGTTGIRPEPARGRWSAGGCGARPRTPARPARRSRRAVGTCERSRSSPSTRAATASGGSTAPTGLPFGELRVGAVRQRQSRHGGHDIRGVAGPRTPATRTRSLPGP